MPRFHDRRHTSVALAINAGAHPKAIQQRLGHASIAITMDRYGHLMAGMDAELAGDLDDLRSAK
jgi:integrase